MQLTRVERWSLANQYRLLELLDESETDYYARAREALEWGFALEYEGLAEAILPDAGTMTESACREVHDILDMYRSLARALDEHPDADPDRLRYGGIVDPDRDLEGSYSEYIEYIDRRSHSSSRVPAPHLGVGTDLSTIRRQLEAWRASEDRHGLTADDLRRISAAAIHPDNR